MSILRDVGSLCELYAAHSVLHKRPHNPDRASAASLFERNEAQRGALTYVTEAGGVNPKLLRQYARDCDLMASEGVDLFTAEALRELAVEFRRAAEAIEGDSRTGRHAVARAPRKDRRARNEGAGGGVRGSMNRRRSAGSR